jgi:hypothetical protein
MTQQQIPQPSLPSPFPKRSKLRAQITITLVAGAVLIAAVLVAGLLSMHPASTTHSVLYEAIADGNTGGGRTGMVTGQTPGGSSQGTGPLPFTATYSFHTGDFVYLSVQNQQPAGSVTCRITVDGVVVSENTSTGGYTIATCQGRVS